MTLMKLVVIFTIAAVGAGPSFICSAIETSSGSQAPAVRNYSLQNGNYQMVAEFVDAVTGAKQPQTLLVEVSHTNGQVQIKAIAGDGGGVIANPIIGTLNGNTFTGYLDDIDGRLDVEGTLTADNTMTGNFYDEHDNLVTSFELSR